MPESEVHRMLVRNIYPYLISKYTKIEKCIIYDTSKDNFSENFTPKIPKDNYKYYYPDFFARSMLKDKFLVIGEAKTINDMETRHSIEQYITYAKYLSSIPGNHILIFSVQYGYRARMVSIIRNKLSCLADNITFEVIEA